MGVCERRMVFERIHGQRRTIDQRLAIERGVCSHQRFYCDRLRRRSLVGRVVSAAFHRIAWCVERWQIALGRDDGRCKYALRRRRHRLRCACVVALVDGGGAAEGAACSIDRLCGERVPSRRCGIHHCQGRPGLPKRSRITRAGRIEDPRSQRQPLVRRDRVVCPAARGDGTDRPGRGEARLHLDRNTRRPQVRVASR